MMNLIHPVWGELTGLSDREEDQILCDIRDRIMRLGEYERYQHHGPVHACVRDLVEAHAAQDWGAAK